MRRILPIFFIVAACGTNKDPVSNEHTFSNAYSYFDSQITHRMELVGFCTSPSNQMFLTGATGQRLELGVYRSKQDPKLATVVLVKTMIGGAYGTHINVTTTTQEGKIEDLKFERLPYSRSKIGFKIITKESTVAGGGRDLELNLKAGDLILELDNSYLIKKNDIKLVEVATEVNIPGFVDKKSMSCKATSALAD